MPLSNLDVNHLARLRDHYAHHGALPSYAGMTKVVGFRAKTSAVKLAERLRAAGFLRSAPGGKLAPAPRFFELPVADTHVRAGVAEAVDGQVMTESTTLDSYLVESPSTTVLIRIRGDSMREAGMLDGDLAIVERGEAAQSGQFVIAVVDGEFTLKELRFEGKHPLLLPHNSAYATIRPKGTLEIFGVVRGIVRRYRSNTAQPQRKLAGGSR